MLQRFFQFITGRETTVESDLIEILGHPLPLIFKRHARARNYVLRLHANRTVVVTVPRTGTKKFAREFVASRRAWLEKQWKVLETRHVPPDMLRPGMEVLFRGELLTLQVEKGHEDWVMSLGEERIHLATPAGNLKAALEKHFLRLARLELPPRVLELAAQHQVSVCRVSVRNQKSRWGSCSHNRTISLNWRLIQIPPEARDYIIIHELMHLRHLNHSKKFWAAVENACPDYRRAEKWLKENSGRIGF